MEKQNKRETTKRNTKPARRDREPSRSPGVRSQTAKRRGKGADTPGPMERRLELTDKPARRSCRECMFCVSDLVLWWRTLASGFPVSGMCANHPDTPGQLRPIPLTPCRNFRAKPYRVEPPQPPNDKVRYISLTRGLHAIVDAEDYEWLNQYKWSVQPSAKARTFYAKRTDRGRLVLMHRLIMRPPRGKCVDHANGNGLDNRRCNLRICNRMQNSCNRSKMRNAKHKFIGVQPCGKHTYRAAVMHNGKTYRAGTFRDEMEAAKARDRLALKLHGKYARLNFPPENAGAEGSSQ